jgi:hypothetical protein
MLLKNYYYLQEFTNSSISVFHPYANYLFTFSVIQISNNFWFIGIQIQLVR